MEKLIAEIETSPGVVPVQIDWMDDNGEWHNFYEKKPKKSKWHDVKSVTPVICRNVLVCDTIGRVRIGYLSPQSQWYVFPIGFAYDPAYWRELPKPPKKAGNK